jgi:DNA repair protein RecN (Recombination protein N)
LNEETTSTIVKLSENERLEEIKEMYGNIVY